MRRTHKTFSFQKMDDWAARRLAAAVILQTLRDLFYPDFRAEALEFFNSEACSAILRALDFNPGWMLRRLPFVPPPTEWVYPRGNRIESERRRRERRIQKLRAAGKGESGEALARTCLNCEEIRTLLGELVCGQGRTWPGTRGQMRIRAGCELWRLRREVKIKELEGSDGDD